MAAAGPILPVGAIAVADPEDVIKATMPPRKPASVAGPSGTQQSTEARATSERAQIYQALYDNMSPEEQADERDGWGRVNPYGDPSGLNPLGTAKSTNKKGKKGGKATGKSKKSDKRRTRRDRKAKEKVNNDTYSEDEVIMPKVPMRVKDTRNELEKYIDGLINAHDALRDLKAFEKGSMLEYIDLIGVSRAEAFAEFPEDVRELPIVPGSKGIGELLSKLKGAQEPADGNMKPENRIAASKWKQDCLLDALNLESRRADLLEYQVKMLRNELVLALKRWKVLGTGVISSLICECRSQDQKLNGVKEGMRSLNTAEPLNTGKSISLRKEHAAVMETYRKRKTYDSANEESSSDTEGGSDVNSIRSSDIWSSSSEDED